MRRSPDGLLPGARYIASPNCDARPRGAAVRLLVLHSISLPPGKYGGDAVERLFTNRLDAHAHPYFREIAHLRVSAHFFVRRDGALQQFVPLHRRAWHAGASRWRGLERRQLPHCRSIMGPFGSPGRRARIQPRSRRVTCQGVGSQGRRTSREIRLAAAALFLGWLVRVRITVHEF